MEQRQLTRSEQKIQKMNSSMIVFRQLIESLRMKNQQLIKPSSSDVNPQIQKQSSSVSRLYGSEKVTSNIHVNVSGHGNSHGENNLILSSSSTPVFSQDDGIKLKVRGNVAGRDVLNKKPSVLPTSKFNQTLHNMKDFAKNKNIASTTVNQTQAQHPALDQIKLLIKKQSSSQSKTQRNSNSQIINQSSHSNYNLNLNNNMTTMPLIKHKFHQNKLNLRATAIRNKIKDVDQKNVIKYCKQAKQLHPGSQANQIFDFFDGLMAQAHVAVLSPFIKKFKNCVYFGAPISEDQIYQGFLYFYQNKIYYGEFIKNQKNGKGVQIYIDEQTIFKGVFKDGQKTGKFWVKKIDENYVGFLEKGLYHGHGKLQNKELVYQGQFQNGEKHGFGQEFYPKTGVKLIGYFDHGVFSKRSKSTFSHSQIEKAIKFKTPGQIKVPFSQNKNHLSARKQKSKNRITEQQIEGTYAQDNFYQNQAALYNHPFSSTSNSFYSKKIPFNKQKIRSILPGMSHQKFIEPMPQNCKDFDYSFDVSSRKDTESFSLTGLQNGQNGRNNKIQRKTFLPPFGQIQQQNNNHLDTSAFEEPLPIPCFYKK